MTTRFLPIALATFTAASTVALPAQEMGRADVVRQAIPALGYLTSGPWKFEMQAALASSKAAMWQLGPALEASRLQMESSRHQLDAVRAELSGLPALGRSGSGEPFRYYPQDPADSLYRSARTEFSRGNFDAAMSIFRSIHRDHPNSRYAPQAMYYEAFSLYRKGGEEDLRQALTVLQGQLDGYPNDVTKDTAALAVRIQGQLAQRGDAEAAEELAQRAEGLVERSQDARERQERSQQELGEDDVRMAALNALMQMDADNAMPILRRVLANQSDETAPLRRKAVFLVSQKRTEGREETLLEAARHDPDEEVRRSAVFYLSQVRTPEAVEALDSILQFSVEPEMQERAIFALSQHRSERAGEILRVYALDPNAPPALRANAIQWLGNSKTTDAGFLRDLFAQLDDAELKEKTLFALSQRRDSTNASFLVDVAADGTQDMETRKRALFWAGQMRLDNARLYEMYDAALDREIKEQLIFVYSQRSKDDAAIDKLIDIARNETDGELRNKAIFWLGRTNDPRAIRLLEEIINND
jgi:HEAT repeat protein